jgi:hypothetical protein
MPDIAELESRAPPSLDFLGLIKARFGARRVRGDPRYPLNPRPMAECPPSGGFFKTTKPARSKCRTTRWRAIEAMYSSAWWTRFRPSNLFAIARLPLQGSDTGLDIGRLHRFDEPGDDGDQVRPLPT